MEINHIAERELSLVAKEAFGSNTRITSCDEIRPLSEHGAWRVAGCNWNLSYIIQIAGDDQKYLFRFNRRRYGRGDETIQKEQTHYKLIAQRTDIPTPRIHLADISHAIVPTGYMIMDYMDGENHKYLTHPNNPITSLAEKDAISYAAGTAVAQIHKITRPPESVTAGHDRVLDALDALNRVVGNHQCRVTTDQINRCKQVVRQDDSLNLNTESLLIGDADLNFVKVGSSWRVAFICDLEYQQYGDPHLDLAHVLCLPDPMWSLKEPLGGSQMTVNTQHPYFVGYEETRPIDYARLSRIATYAHLCSKCSVARKAYRADDEGNIADREPAIYYKLLNAVEELSNPET